jgi:putative ABC transport system permease protein
MLPGVLLRLSLQGLLAHRLRSLLSILGIVFGVAAVVAMASVGEGARREALEQIGALGIDSISVRARGSSPGRLQLSDARAIAAVVPDLLSVAPVREAALTADLAGRHADVVVVATTPSYSRAARLPIASGRFLADLDVDDSKAVAVLGASLASQLSPLADPQGSQVRVGGDWYTVVGVLEGRAAPHGKAGPIRTRDVNRCVFVPLPVLGQGRGPEGIDEIVLRVADASRVVPDAEVVRALLRRRTGGIPLDIVVPQEILRQRERTQRIFDIVTGAVAAIGLLIGGIGIMNIMLANVAERTAEIGVRRALGAARQDIAAQFLAEASLLTLVGGCFGLALGAGGSILIQRLADWPTALSPGMLAAAIAMALAVGIGFGLHPALRASGLAPMAALRRG